MLIVQKYGGTSLADVGLIRKAAQRAAQLARQGHGVVVVVSAQGDTTDRLIAQAAPFGIGTPRELDAHMAVGEQMSAALMAMAIHTWDCPAVSLTGAQAGILTDDNYTNARIRHVDTRRLRKILDRGAVAVVAGFQGMNAEGDITTLGRGGSDTTAVALASALRADMCQIYTDVDGVYDKDPRKHTDAQKFHKIGYEQMLSLARGGAQVLHDRCVELARDRRVQLEVLSAFSDTPGTVVGPLDGSYPF